MPDRKSIQFLSKDFPLAKELLDRLVLPSLLVLCSFLFGTVGFLLIGGGQWNLLDCAYMTSITLTTVGYGEVLERMGPSSRIFAMALMWSGMGVTLYAVSAITGFVVEKNFARILKERKMERRIAALKDHVIVCGAGKTGFNVIKELYTTKHPSVLIEGNQDRLDRVRQHFEEMHCLRGDATEEEVLVRAGIERAAGIIAVLNDDSHNLLITVQARYINPNIKIVARCEENSLAEKFYRAGANYVVNPAFIGGMRMASEMIRPHVVSFLDRMLRGKDESIRVEEVVVGAGSGWAGMSLGDADIFGKTGLTPISLQRSDGGDFIYNPSPDERLNPGVVLIVIGNTDQISKLRRHCAS